VRDRPAYQIQRHQFVFSQESWPRACRLLCCFAYQAMTLVHTFYSSSHVSQGREMLEKLKDLVSQLSLPDSPRTVEYDWLRDREKAKRPKDIFGSNHRGVGKHVVGHSERDVQVGDREDPARRRAWEENGSSAAWSAGEKAAGMAMRSATNGNLPAGIDRDRFVDSSSCDCVEICGTALMCVVSLRLDRTFVRLQCVCPLICTTSGSDGHATCKLYPWRVHIIRRICHQNW
jgi:hypothetical protein